MNTDTIQEAGAPLGARKYPQKARAYSAYRIAKAAEARKRWSENAWKTRFKKQVRQGDPDVCWPFTGHDVSNRGYGRFHMLKKRFQAHRIAFELENGPVPKHLFVCHKCDNPICCNPSHLFLGTAKDNTRDMMQKRRNRPRKGEQHWNHKLTDIQVQDILYACSKGEVSRASIAKFFNVGTSAIDDIANRVNWKHVITPTTSSSYASIKALDDIPVVYPNRRGECAANAKLTNEQAAEIRVKYIPHVKTQRMLAAEYGVSESTICWIVNNKHFVTQPSIR